MNKRFKLYEGDNIQSLKKMPDNSIDSVVTDPPYGLSFMGKKWDYDVPSVEFWKEVYRVLKPGGHVLSFGGTRTYHRMVVNIEDAGFEIRDQIMWLYGSGFPKSLNVGKVVDKFNKTGNASWNGTGDSSKGALGYSKLQKEQGYRKEDYANRHQNDEEVTNQWKGYGTALKPANEPICVARKPLSEANVAANVIKWGTGGINIDGCRVGTEHMKGQYAGNKETGFTQDDNRTDSGKGLFAGNKETPEYTAEGRFPANIIFECICDEVIKGEKGEVKKSGFRTGGKSENSVGLNGIKDAPDNYNDTGDIHTNPDCPCYMLDQQSGKCKSGNRSSIELPKKFFTTTASSGNSKSGKYTERGYNDTIDGASRFFYQAKVSKSERNMGLEPVEVFSGRPRREDGSVIYKETHPEEWKESTKNVHPTVKPVALMAYLCRLVTPENGIILDPFMGSGSTGIASQLEGFRFVGCEMEPDYIKIASKRIEEWEKYKKFIK